MPIPLLELVFFHLAEKVAVHGSTATKITVGYEKTPAGLILRFEDNGTGIPKDMKEQVFQRTSVRDSSMGLFFAKEILGITGITITETGTFGKGACFEILVPEKCFRFSGDTPFRR